jgi:antitoxin (DNA-binding transcriptional repressor) of toxin-antitoxin stability system
MEHRISATELARRVGDVLGRVRYLGDTFVVERNGTPIARISPVSETRPAATLSEFFEIWRSAGPPDPDFADALELVGSLDTIPEDPWGS